MNARGPTPASTARPLTRRELRCTRGGGGGFASESWGGGQKQFWEVEAGLLDVQVQEGAQLADQLQQFTVYRPPVIHY